jgi:Acyltransferase
MPSRTRYTSPLHATARFVAQRGMLKPLVWRLVTVTVLGEEKLRGLNRPFVVVSNHASHLDAPLILGSLPSKLARYVAAGAAADYFFDVWWRKGLTSLFFNAFPVDRTGLRGRHGLATSLLDDGVPLLLFPEGTRSRTGEMASSPAPRRSPSAVMCRASQSRSLVLPRPCRTARIGPVAGGWRSTSLMGSRCEPRTAKRSRSSPTASLKKCVG